ncbi:MAG: hypothetical protein ACOX7R_06075 [Acetivibrionales bacterium]|jgi:sugar (pentulose or hexulose) kinase
MPYLIGIDLGTLSVYEEETGLCCNTPVAYGGGDSLITKICF